MNATAWIEVGLGVATSLMIAELLDLAAWVSPRIVRNAARRLPGDATRERYAEEWAAELAALDGLKLIKLGKALGIWWGAWQMRLTVAPTPVITVRSYCSAFLKALPGFASKAFEREWPDTESAPGSYIMVKQSQANLGFLSVVLDQVDDLTINFHCSDQERLILDHMSYKTSNPICITRWAIFLHQATSVLLLGLLAIGTVWSTRSLRLKGRGVRIDSVRNCLRRI